jgi:hypothetical protein
MRSAAMVITWPVIPVLPNVSSNIAELFLVEPTICVSKSPKEPLVTLLTRPGGAVRVIVRPPSCGSSNLMHDIWIGLHLEEIQITDIFNPVLCGGIRLFHGFGSRGAFHSEIYFIDVGFPITCCRKAEEEGRVIVSV